MPFTTKGIYYPGPKFPAQLAEDLLTLGSNAFDHIDALAARAQAGADTLIAPTTYTSAPNGGDLVSFTSGLNDNLVWIQFAGQWKKLTTATCGAAIFINGNQLKSPVNNGAPAVQEVSDAVAFSSPGFFGLLYTTPVGLQGSASATADSSMSGTGTGFVVSGAAPCCIVGLAPGTYTIEVKYKASAGNLVLGQRYLMAGIMKGV